MELIRYSGWDGTQQVFPLDNSAIMGELADHLLANGDVNAAFRNMMRKGIPGRFGERSMGVQELLQQLQSRRQQQLQKYDLSSVLDGIREKLTDVLKHEEEGIQRQ